jgi:hypothetical protein
LRADSAAFERRFSLLEIHTDDTMSGKAAGHGCPVGGSRETQAKLGFIPDYTPAAGQHIKLFDSEPIRWQSAQL